MLLQERDARDTELWQEEEAEAKAEAYTTRLGLTMFMDQSRLDGGSRNSVVWKKGLPGRVSRCTWAATKSLMMQSAAIAHDLEIASQRNTTPVRVTIFSDAQVAIRRMASDEPGPGQKHAIQARRHIAALRLARPGITIKIR